MCRGVIICAVCRLQPHPSDRSMYILFLCLAIVHAAALLPSSLVGQIHFPAWNGRCLDFDDINAATSPVVLNECDSSISTQLWRVDSFRSHITTMNGNKCLSIHENAQNSDEFINQVIEAAACKYISSGRSSVKGHADGFQKLVFANETIIWRGQSKVLPSELSERYCLEVADYEEIGVTVVLRHCIAGEPQQHFAFEDSRRHI